MPGSRSKLAVPWFWALALALPFAALSQVTVKPAAAPKITAPVIKLPPARSTTPAKMAPSAAASDRQRLFESLRRSQEQATSTAAARIKILRPAIPRERPATGAIPPGYTYRHAQGLDCDDTQATVHRRASEVCDHVDNNCDGAVDEGQQLAFFLDADGDGHGDPGRRLLACASDQQRAWPG